MYKSEEGWKSCDRQMRDRMAVAIKDKAAYAAEERRQKKMSRTKKSKEKGAKMKTYILCFSDNEWAEVVATNEDEAKVQAFLFTRKDVGPVLLYCFERGERCPEECKATTQERGERDQLILQFRRFKKEGRWFVQVYKSNNKHWVGHYLISETLVFHPWW